MKMLVFSLGKCVWTAAKTTSSETQGQLLGGDGIFTGESLQQERESPWAFTLTERVPEAFEILPSDWPEKSAKTAR